MLQKYLAPLLTVKQSGFASLKNLFQEISVYILVASLSGIILILSLRLWEADIGIPFRYDGDAVFNLMTIKTLIDNHWFLINPYIGAPFGMEAYDFPFDETITLLILKAIASLSNHFFAHNLFYILTFPLTAVTSFFALKQIRISSKVALVTSLLYTFVPYHFLRLGHLFLAAYYMIPLIVLIILSLWSDKPPLISSADSDRIKFELFSRRSLLCILICIVLGSTGMYYSFFSCFLIAVTCVCVFLRKGDKRVVVSGGILIFLISSVLLTNLSPSLIYWMINGVNSEVAHRSPFQTEEQGLKIIHLLLPVRENVFPLLRNLAEKYDDLFPYSFRIYSEPRFASLGIVGSIGFLLLILKIFLPQIRFRTEGFSHYYYVFSTLNIAAVLYATVGGFGTAFALLVSPQLRGLNRISIFIAFFSLAAVALFLDKIQRGTANSRLKATLFNVSLVLILVLGLLDQVSPAFIPNYSQIKNDYLNDQEFAHEIEKNIPANSLIFQLPYVSYPEVVHPNGQVYDHFRPYLHSKSLKWSYGVMRGRHDWQESLMQEPFDLDIFLSKIALVGFTGVYIDRVALNSSAETIEKELQKKTSSQPIVSKDNRFAFYNIADFRQKLLSRFNAEQVNWYRDRILYPVETKWQRGFYEIELLPPESWHWAEKEAELVLRNSADFPRKLQLKMSLLTGQNEPSTLHIRSAAFSKDISISATPLPFILPIELSDKEEVRITFTSDARRVNALSDTRQLYFQIRNFEVVEDGLNF